MKAKIIKYTTWATLIVLVFSGLFYLNLSNRHKAIVKSKLLYALNIVDNKWEAKTKNGVSQYTSPTFVIDNIYKSMEGPKASVSFAINSGSDSLIWLTSFKTSAITVSSAETLSNDFICHSNIDFNSGSYYSKFNLHYRIGQEFPRITTISNGLENYTLPNGFGIPMFSDEKLLLNTQALNHNLKDSIFSLKHKIEIGFIGNSKPMKALQSKSLFIALPYNSSSDQPKTVPNSFETCLPVDLKNHVYYNSQGVPVSGHWYINPGKSVYKSNVTTQLGLTQDTWLHFAVSHLHPFAEELQLINKTEGKKLIGITSSNKNNSIGVLNTSYFSNNKGILLKANHDYELKVTINNTSNEIQDMMASLYVFLYDEELDERVQLYLNNKNENF